MVVEDEPYMGDPDGLRLRAIAADIAGDGGTALERLSVNAYDIAALASPLGLPATRSLNASSPPAVACRSSCLPPPTASTTSPPGSG
jgi:hypothetical protein